MLCGMLCSRPGTGTSEWIGELLGGAPGSPGADDELDATRAETVRQLESTSLEFAPLLPEDDAPLSLRTSELSRWCQGFLYGLGIGGARLTGTSMSSEANEALADLGELSNMAPEYEETESAESDYNEVVEYVRVVVMLIHEELARGPDRAAPGERIH